MNPALVSRVLDKLAVERPAAADLPALKHVYAAWCGAVPFDNLFKRRHLVRVREGQVGKHEPLPGTDPDAFFEDWLEHSAGGTCWAANGALHALLGGLGFDVTRGLATMLVAPDLPPNHGTVGVDLDGRRYLVDASILTHEPLLLDADAPRGGTGHAAADVRCDFEGEHFVVGWRPLGHDGWLSCRIERFGLDQAEFDARHEQTRTWSPFNFGLSLRVNRGSEVVGVTGGQRGRLDTSGEITLTPLPEPERVDYLVGLGISRALAESLPPDEPMPRPPGR